MLACCLLGCLRCLPLQPSKPFQFFYATSHGDVSIAETCPAFVTLTSLCDVAQKIEMIWSVEVEDTSNQAYASNKQAWHTPTLCHTRSAPHRVVEDTSDGIIQTLMNPTIFQRFCVTSSRNNVLHLNNILMIGVVTKNARNCIITLKIRHLNIGTN